MIAFRDSGKKFVPISPSYFPEFTTCTLEFTFNTARDLEPLISV